MKNVQYVKQLCIYFSITVLITWLLWTPSILFSRGLEVPTAFLILSMGASFTPSVVGMVLHRRYLGKNAFILDMKERLNFGFNKGWLIGIPLYFFSTAGLTYGLMRVLDQRFQLENTPDLLMMPLFFLQILFFGGALGEEFGWRGFAQPRLQRLLNPIMTSLILGSIWSLWHLPLFFIVGTVQENIPLWQFMLQNTVITFYYTWLYKKSRGNLWLMIYLHTIANTSAAVVPYWQSMAGRLIGLLILVIGLVSLYVAYPIKKKATCI